jgi:F-type H+-transporting ATPase subunit gamma
MGELLQNLVSRIQTGDEEQAIHPLLEVRPAQRIALIHISADRGLAGGLNANVNRRASQFLLEQTAPVSIIAVGRKGRDFMLRFRRNVVAEFTGMPDYPTVADILPISTLVRQGFETGEFDQVFLSYTRFYSMAVQRPELLQLLPIPTPPDLPDQVLLDYIYEPDAATILDELLPRYVEMTVYQAILEAVGSFYSAQMVAMRNATDSAKEIVADLTLAFNKARQEMITSELLDIVGGVAALE